MDNSVRGPTSAMTEFLREHGITPRTVAVRARTRTRLNQSVTAEPEAGPSNATDGDDEEEAGSSRKRGRDEGYASDELDEPEDEEEGSRKRRQTAKGKGKASGKAKKDSQADAKAKSKSKAKAKAKGKKNKKGSDDEDDSEDEYNALPSMFSPSKRNADPSARPPNGSFEECAICEKDFTVTRYTVAADPGPGWLCHDCAKASGADPFKKPAPRKRKAPTDKRSIVNFEEPERIQPLSTICVNIITKHLDEVEALGDIGVVNTNEILRVIAKKRCLTAENSQLFYNIRNTNLTLYDATNLKPEALSTLASLNPNLESLRLDFCGLMNNDALVHAGEHLRLLTRIELLGPFLVRVEGWKKFFELKALLTPLTGFLVTQSPRFDLSCVESLVKHHPSLTELRLSELGKMSDAWLTPLSTLTSLTSLELSGAHSGLGDGAAIALLAAVGSKLELLNLSSNERLTDALLNDGILKHCRVLKCLILSNLPLISDEGVAKFFSGWGNKALQRLDLSRCHAPTSAALEALLEHSGPELTFLSINSWKEVGNDALMAIGEKAKGLVKFDVSWCREMDNFVMKALLSKCTLLEWVKCYGCNRIDEHCPIKPGVAIYGIEAHTAARDNQV